MAALDLALCSFLFLFAELALIRWVTASVFLLAYFTNIVLIGCFLGFGAGCALKSKRSFFPETAFFLFLTVISCWALEGRRFANPFADTEFVFSASGSMAWTFILGVLYALIVCLFGCLGQKIGQLLERFNATRGYELNIAGSVAGTLVFTLCSYAEARPAIWFGIIGLLFAWLLRDRIRTVRGGLALFLLILSTVIVAVQQRQAIWSPYYKIILQGLPPSMSGSFQLQVNHDQHQLALNLSDGLSKDIPFYRHWHAIYNFPYDTLGRKPKRVLVLGAGTGNDVAAALRAGAEHIDAVELDPKIFELGRQLHPEKPYDDPRVQIHLNDARYFLRQNQNRYDVVVLGWLDSHRLFSVMSTIRQDNFMYTADAMTQIRGALEKDGVLFLSFYVGRGWVARKLFDMLQTAFGRGPTVFNYPAGGYGEDGHIFSMASDPSWQPRAVPGFVELNAIYNRLPPTPIPTDDWPYLYMKGRWISSEYAAVLAFLALLSAGAVLWVLPKPIRLQKTDWAVFLLGAAFMLLETKNMTVLALQFGSTWMTTAWTVTGVLTMILLSLRWVENGSAPSEKNSWFLLLGSVVLSMSWHDQWVPGGAWIKGAVTAGVLSLSFLFANLVFIRCYARSKNPRRAFGLNILGSVVGGLAEYGTVFLGIRAMYGFVLLFYVGAWWVQRGKTKA